MVEYLEALQAIGLFAGFVVTIVAAVVVGLRDAKRHQAEHEARIQRQLEVLKRAKAQAEAAAERRRLWEAWVRHAAEGGNGFQPSIFVISPPRAPRAEAPIRIPAAPRDGGLASLSR